MATVEFISLIGLLGLAGGSFLNVCIDRLPRGLSIVALPFHCEHYAHRLTPLGHSPGAQLLVAQRGVSLL